jgi:hypothetical protein
LFLLLLFVLLQLSAAGVRRKFNWRPPGNMIFTAATICNSKNHAV